ncbi:MAG: tRNA 2-thiouridine(34) synthase MnmA [Chloroflexi bacterium]|nr:tRNA 2-thiouridine(34) synthase MnmA [Chloroflexota bacterium]MCY3583798.1 tRNA 2-thiouridine(34) synthase MnmA [Chloroflexota bacterium]MCY3716270.1 tRNA 2-thiouridine(34) synthase MnmA [Chloroflexota bacterium]MDE2650401.1 tRNA 2-thiouridine(34) synthase MnmA [Chloroflexota bacterium]MXX51321.1 tRNA 2-thiouridine(34) synthase MnmA [Chloroflexota bacterium]
MNKRTQRVVVAMSGGVDSSVAAALLARAGYDVVGMMMRLWSEPAMGGAAHNRCCTPTQMSDARRIADQLGIPFFVLDTQDVFRGTVVQAFIAGHRSGDTPNPCLECNRRIRFEWLLNHALALDADYLATGHYARITRDAAGGWQLRRGRDDNKDQSYVLSVLGQAQLSRAMFPVGGYPKAQVRALAAELGLDVAGRQDSQDLCFLGQGDYRDFLRLHAPDVMRAGPIMTTTGNMLGEHGGLANYTIGQRKGLGLSYREPLYVLATNPLRNALIVGTRDQLGRDFLTAEGVNWVSGAPPDSQFRAQVKIRYRAQPQPAEVLAPSADSFEARFDEPQRDITPGQAAVIYADDICLGGGIIAKFADEP